MKGKGTLGQMVEELYYHYKANSDPTPDFEEAGVELKTTGLKRLKDLSLQIKERLVVDMIDYNDVVNQSFEMSLFYKKCRLMLLLFYLYDGRLEQYDRYFLFVALWKIPEKDLLLGRIFK
jgi:DNA mismatch repair protein MutH